MPGKRKKPLVDSTPVYTYQCVKKKLNQLCDLDFLIDEICTMASELKLVGLLGWKIAGMHRQFGPHEARDVETITINMLALHFRRWLHQYIRFRYAKTGKLQFGYKAMRKLVAGYYRVKKAPHLGVDGADTGKVVYVWGEPRSTAERELRDWLGFVPWEWRIRQNPTHFIVKLCGMLQWMDAFVEKHPKTKGACLYSLLPYSSSFVPAHVTLNITSLHQVFRRLFTDPERQI
ncbi:hypothetical protein PHYSODRAFT_255019 [Phytophthora sojae]|uniref:Uncharacterized protein n=1 Tax=Phytophthora sojae (strain P6497) TaxID=1094619 RepID=G4YV32_PHYSP|nr:hypothetical protein PHYSODRAFT_255019 [Phytophthora sojae]EGZ23702.1 hypothetical protein PHYSODRAFT_255019 [Phytophthora sojae]|eukprot:XP_009518990.1 hypothetical protein PHYSODRAFT_255019 [Phytophthora sojae]